MDRVAAHLGLGWARQRVIAAALRQELQTRLHVNLGLIRVPR